jgi:hypothetical protein
MLGHEALLAYVGPGADLGLVSYALAFLAWIVLSFGALVLWPIRAMIRRLRVRKGDIQDFDGVPTTSSGPPSTPIQRRENDGRE